VVVVVVVVVVVIAKEVVVHNGHLCVANNRLTNIQGGGRQVSGLTGGGREEISNEKMHLSKQCQALENRKSISKPFMTRVEYCGIVNAIKID
jgi:hypothetical protein